MAVGISFYSLPLCIYGMVVGTTFPRLIDAIALLINLSIIVSSFIALKVIADEMFMSIRIYTVGVWLIDVILIGLIFFDLLDHVTYTWESVLEVILRILEILIYAFIGVQLIHFWDMYSEAKSETSRSQDTWYSVWLCVLLTFVLAGFIFTISVSESDAWRIMYW